MNRPGSPIELGMDEVRQEVAYYEVLAKIISNSQSTYLYGKGFERVRAAAIELRTKMASPGVVCDTRFCSSECKVLKNWFYNAPLYIRDMRKQYKTMDREAAVTCEDD